MDIHSKEILKRIANLSKEQIGDSEENVKYKFVIPFLKCFGHEEIDLEHYQRGNRIDIYIGRNKSSCGVIVEVKKYDAFLDNYLSQLKSYCDEKSPYLAVILNGEEIRFYSPFWRGIPNFKDRILYSIKRENLKDENIIQRLEKLLSKENLENEQLDDYIKEREDELKKIKKDIEILTVNYSKQIAEKEKEIEDLKKKELKEKNEIREKFLLPTIFERKLSEFEIKPIERKISMEKFDKDTIAIELGGKEQSWRKYNLINVPKDYRTFFPGYKEDFIFETDIGEIKSWITGAPAGTKIGDKTAGYYIQGGLKEFYDAHKELKNGDRLIIKVIEPMKRYKLEIQQS